MQLHFNQRSLRNVPSPNEHRETLLNLAIIGEPTRGSLQSQRRMKNRGDHMGRVHGSPVEYSSYDVTYAAGCRERVTRPARLHGIIKKIEMGEARGRGTGWEGKTRWKRRTRWSSSSILQGSWPISAARTRTRVHVSVLVGFIWKSR